MSDIGEARFIDVHYHVAPDAFVRRHSALAAGSRYRAAGGWVFLKNHLGSTTAQAWEARQEGLPVSGSVVLNEIGGGINWRLIECALCQHGDGAARLIVHLPTVTGRKHASRLVRTHSHPILSKREIAACTVTDDQGRLKESVIEILRMARDYPLVISTGHANRDEVYRLVDAAVQHDVPRLMLNQPANPLTGLRAQELLDLSQAPMVFIEQTALTYLLGYQDRDDFQTVLADVPRVVYSSDLGQTSQPDIDDWLLASSGWFEEFGLSAERIDDIARANPLAMLT